GDKCVDRNARTAVPLRLCADDLGAPRLCRRGEDREARPRRLRDVDRAINCLRGGVRTIGANENLAVHGAECTLHNSLPGRRQGVASAGMGGWRSPRRLWEWKHRLLVAGAGLGLLAAGLAVVPTRQQAEALLAPPTFGQPTISGIGGWGYEQGI